MIISSEEKCRANLTKKRTQTLFEETGVQTHICAVTAIFCILYCLQFVIIFLSTRNCSRTKRRKGYSVQREYRKILLWMARAVSSYSRLEKVASHMKGEIVTEEGILLTLSCFKINAFLSLLSLHFLLKHLQNISCTLPLIPDNLLKLYIFMNLFLSLGIFICSLVF